MIVVNRVLLHAIARALAPYYEAQMNEQTDKMLAEATASIQGLHDDARPKAAVAALKALLNAVYALRDEIRAQSPAPTQQPTATEERPTP